MVIGLTSLATLEIQVSDWPLRNVTLNVVSYRRLPSKHEQRSRSIAWKTFTVSTDIAISV